MYNRGDSMQYKVGQDVWMNHGTDTSVSWPIKVRIISTGEDECTVAWYDDHAVRTALVYVLDLYPDRESLLKVYNQILDDSEKEFEETKQYIDNYKK